MRSSTIAVEKVPNELISYLGQLKIQPRFSLSTITLKQIILNSANPTFRYSYYSNPPRTDTISQYYEQGKTEAIDYSLSFCFAE